MRGRATVGCVVADSSLVIVRTERLVIRTFCVDDAERLHRYRNEPDVAQYQGWTTPYPLDDARNLAEAMAAQDPFLLGTWTQLAIAHATDPDHHLIGDIAVRMEAEEPTAEVGFSLDPQYWGQGIVAEGLTAVVDHLFGTLALARVVAFTDANNERAHRTLERAGLRFITTDGDDLVYYRRAD